jgi:tRNA (guanine-N7-)-methyltransferase
MKNSQSSEREFGVPIAGEILDPSRWARTALKKLPVEGPLDFAALFGRTAPLIVDLGCGNGRFLITSAVGRPDHDHIGIDILPMVLRYATRRGNQRGLHNLRLAAIDAQTFVAKYLPAGSVREMHCYHPQPYHHPRDTNKRLITPGFLAQVHRALEAGGTWHVQTDNLPYWRYMKSLMPAFFDFQELPTPWPDAPRGRTRREIIALKRGYMVYRGRGVVRSDVTSEQAFAAAATMPPPAFNAGPRLRDLDAMESDREV